MSGSPEYAANNRRLVVVVKGFPRLSETFVAQEIRELERRGFAIRVASLRPADMLRHAVHDEIVAPVLYLPEFAARELKRVVTGWWIARAKSGYKRALTLWIADLFRSPTRVCVRNFVQALVLAAEMPPGFTHIHAHFIHSPASVAFYAAEILGYTWTVSAHAKDVWTTPDRELARKLAHCRWATTCSRAAYDKLASLGVNRQRISLIRHGVDLSRFPPAPLRTNARTGADASDPVILLSVGRMVPKKGYDDLLDALARMPASLHWKLVHVGHGPLLEVMKRRAIRLGISDRVVWHGPCTHPSLLSIYRAADIFVLACRETPDGDRDGIPNALVEAQSQGLACVAGALAGIREIIADDVTGVLVRPGAAGELAHALGSLIRDPHRRQRLGTAAGQWVRGNLCHHQFADRIAAMFDRILAAQRR